MNTNKKLDQKNALITGASHGIGRAIAMKFAEEGANLVIGYHSDRKAAESVVEYAGQLGVRAKAIGVDLSQFAAVEPFWEAAKSFLGSVEILVNNAAVITRKTFLEISTQDYDRVLTTNLKTPFFLLQRVGQHMIDRQIKGSIINISSVSAISPVSKMAHYQCSKAGLNALTMSAAYELGPFGIRVNTIMPGLTATNTNRNQWEGDPQLWAKRKAGIPLGRAGVANDHAGAALLLASDESEWTTGAELIIDGGAFLG